MPNFQRIMLAAVALTGLPALASAAEATPPGRQLLQPPRNVIASPITDRFAVRVLYYGPQVDNKLRYDNAAGVPGTSIDVEEFLDQPDSQHFGTIDLAFRISEKHRIHADFFQLSRTGDRVIDQPFRFGDEVYNTNARLVSEMDLRKVGLTYTYSFWRREKFEIGAGLGIHLVQLQGSVENPATFADEQLDTAGPFAALAGQATWRFLPRFSLNLTGQYLDLSPDDVRGAYRNFQGDVQFRAYRNLAVGVGYSYQGYLVDSTDPEFAGYYRLVYQGPQAFFRVSF